MATPTADLAKGIMDKMKSFSFKDAAKAVAEEDRNEKQAKLMIERETRQHEKKLAAYQSVLDRYQEERAKAKKLEEFIFPQVVPPFQMAIPDEYQMDFSDGIGKAMTSVKDKFVNAILEDIKPQIREKLTVEPFMHKDGAAKLGITVYLLSETDMMDLEEAIKSSMSVDTPDK